MPKSLTYAQVVEAAGSLTLEEQEALSDLLRRRAIAARRRQLAKQCRNASAEQAAGKARPTTADALMREIRR